jgi:hypothetical protein
MALIGRGYRRVAFADPLREMALAVDPILFTSSATEDSVYRLSDLVGSLGWDKAKQHPEVRRTLMRLGTEAVRGVLGQDVWVETADRRIGPDERIVFTDIRFDNEATYVRRNGGMVVRIVRPGKDGDAHASEQGISGHLVDAEIVNCRSVEELHSALIAVASR